MEPTTDLPETLPVEGHAPSLAGATAWLNSPELDLADLRGRVVVADFCTYTCINWIRTLPYVRAWEERYRDDGLVMIGIHTPEFSFEHELENIRTALRQKHVTYPIGIDNDYAVWQAFANHYWPALYFIDAQGRIRHHRFGEGDYERWERVIQQLLAEAGVTGIQQAIMSVDAQGPEVEADWSSLRSPETYLGFRRTERFASPGGPLPDEQGEYGFPASLELNRWALSGAWTMSDEASTTERTDGRVAFRFHARDVHLVMGPSDGGVRFRVSIDGEPPGSAHGSHVDAQRSGVLNEPRMYQLVRQHVEIVDGHLGIEFLDPGAQVFAFTFG